MTDNAVAIRTPEQLQENINIIQSTMKRVMKNGIHFGTIPGTGKPSLFKPGAEIIMSVFRFVPTYDVTDLSIEGMVRYRITTTIATQGGEIVGTGVGECSTAEEKFCWRKALCKEEFEEAAPHQKRKVWKKSGQNVSAIQQIKTNPFDLSNTVLKMAKKRSLIDALLTATAASDLFSQDTEDLPKEYVSQYADESNQSTNNYKQSVKAKQQPVSNDEDVPLPPETYEHKTQKPDPKTTTKKGEKKADPVELAKKLYGMLEEYFFNDLAAMEECCVAMTDYRGKGLSLEELEGATQGRLYHAVQNMEKFLETAGDADRPFNEG